MLVCLRRIASEEVCSQRPAPKVEDLYVLTTSQGRSVGADGEGGAVTVTVADVADQSARKTALFDKVCSSSSELGHEILLPLLRRITDADRSASQAVMVVDGTQFARETVIFGCDGLLQTAFRALMRMGPVAFIFAGSTTLCDGDCLEDTLGRLGAQEDGQQGASPTIIEDSVDRFTAVEDIEYETVSEDNLDSLVRALQCGSRRSQHQVISIIISFADGSPNTTLQIVSLAVQEIYTRMKSTRHSLTTAAALIEARAPFVTFSGSQLCFLLKPALLGWQPGAWISCAVPSSPPTDDACETFREAFCIFQSASRIYSSRISVTNSASQLASCRDGGAVAVAQTRGANNSSTFSTQQMETPCKPLTRGSAEHPAPVPAMQHEPTTTSPQAQQHLVSTPRPVQAAAEVDATMNQFLEMISYHQKELRDSNKREEEYRRCIVEMERLLKAKENVIAELRQQLDRQSSVERAAPAAARPSASSRPGISSSTVDAVPESSRHQREMEEMIRSLQRRIQERDAEMHRMRDEQESRLRTLTNDVERLRHRLAAQETESSVNVDTGATSSHLHSRPGRDSAERRDGGPRVLISPSRGDGDVTAPDVSADSSSHGRLRDSDRVSPGRDISFEPTPSLVETLHPSPVRQRPQPQRRMSFEEYMGLNPSYKLGSSLHLE